MITINLTTTYQRLNLCRITLVSLLLQSRLPDQINLWISQEPYLRDEGFTNKKAINSLIKSLPEENRDLIKIRWVSNTGPYRKLIPILREANNTDLIITADDDIFYGQKWLSGLLRAYEEAEGKVVATRVRIKKKNLLGIKTSYLHWPIIKEPIILKDNYIITFGGGTILTRSMFCINNIYDDEYLKIAATADDLWYSKLLKENNNEIIVVPNLLNELHFIQHTDGLTNHNVQIMTNFIGKIRFHVWDKFIGLIGFPVCGNDIAYRKINKYFKN